jgi:hypothetical protein lgasM_02069
MEEFNMTEETTNVTPEQNKVMTTHTYYWSNNDIPFRVMQSADVITENQYPLVITPPDPSLKAPKYDWMNNKWIETSEESFGQRITEVAESVKNIKESISNLQEAQQDNAKNTEQSNTAMEQMQKTIQMSNRMMGTLSATVTALTKAYQDLNKSTENKTETKQGDAE